jgi:hypothetical protein
MDNNKKRQILSAASKLIKEQVWNAGKYDTLIRILKRPDVVERVHKYPYQKLLYLDKENPIPLIWISSTEQEKVNSKQTFIEILNTLPVIKCESLLFALTCYQQFNDQDFNQILNKSKEFLKVPPVLANLLSPSFGYLVYAHQLEQIYTMLTGASSTEAITFRKDWNIKRRTTREMVSNIIIDDKSNLMTLINNRALDQKHFFCFHAPWRSAYHLYMHIFNDTPSEKL